MFLRSQCHGDHSRPQRHNWGDPLDHVIGTYIFVRFLYEASGQPRHATTTQSLQSNLIAPERTMRLTYLPFSSLQDSG